MELYLVRHGQAYSEDEDVERPLNPHGKEEVALIGDYLNQKNCKIQKIFHSEKLRAIETAKIIANCLGLTQYLTLLSSLDPQEDVYRLIGDIHETSMNTLMVGHLPNLALASNFLLTGNMNKTTVSFSTATVACLEFQDPSWVLKWSLDPATITASSKK